MKYTGSALIATFKDSLSNLSSQKGSFYALSVVGRIPQSIDIDHLAPKARAILLAHIEEYPDGYTYIANKGEYITSKHEQLIILLSTLYMLHVAGDGVALRTCKIKLVPSIYKLAQTLYKDTQKTVVAEILLIFYIRKCIQFHLIEARPVIQKIVSKYMPLYRRKIRERKAGMFFSIEGCEDLPDIEEHIHFIQQHPYLIGTVETYAFLASHGVDGMYKKLKHKIKEANAFEFGEVFEVAWQFHCMLYSGILDATQIEEVAQIVCEYAKNADFSNKNGVSISRYFTLKDADTTAMVYKAFASIGIYIPLTIFAPYLQVYKREAFFSAYPGEIRPSLGTMADIMDAMSYSNDDAYILAYIKILHTKLATAIREKTYAIDKWHSSPLYFLANALIAYTNLISKKAPILKEVPSLYVSICLTRDMLVTSIIEDLYQERWCEEKAWGLLALSHYKRIAQISDPVIKDIIVGTIKQTSILVKDLFEHTYKGNVENMEKLWIVKVAYNPINVVKSVIISSLASAHAI